MKLLLALPLLFAIGPAGPARADGDEPVRICHFSLNNEDEFQVTKDFLAKLNNASPVKIEVQEFMPEGANPDDAFTRMVKSGARCDGIVISGHHTGAYGGHRSKGKLHMETMEALACDPANADFFQHLNAAWLQGCRTLGIGEIEADDAQTADADFHTNRVGAALDEDGLAGDFAQLNMEFSNTLDQDNPLASRYLRLFPNAKLFGWTKTAPGEKANSYLSLLYHMAQTARRLDAEDKYPLDAPDAKNMSAASAAKFADAMLLTLSHFTPEQKGCETIATDGWLAQGNVGRPGKYFFDNSDLKAFTSLASSGDNTLFDAKALDCGLKAAARDKNPEKMRALLDSIAQRPEFLRYSFNTLVDLRASLAAATDPKSKKADPASAQLAKIILDQMKANPKVLDFLKSKLSSAQVGFVRKIDYYKFDKLLTGETDSSVENDIRARAMEELMRPLPDLNPVAPHPARSRLLAASYRATVVQSIVKNDLAGPDFYDDMLDKKPAADVLSSLAMQSNNYSKQDRVQRLLAIAHSPHADPDTGASVMKALRSSGAVTSQSQWDDLQSEVQEATKPKVDADGKPIEQNFFEKLFNIGG